MEMFLDVVGDMGVTGKSSNDLLTALPQLVKLNYSNMLRHLILRALEFCFQPINL